MRSLALHRLSWPWMVASTLINFNYVFFVCFFNYLSWSELTGPSSRPSLAFARVGREKDMIPPPAKNHAGGVFKVLGVFTTQWFTVIHLSAFFLPLLNILGIPHPSCWCPRHLLLPQLQVLRPASWWPQHHEVPWPLSLDMGPLQEQEWLRCLAQIVHHELVYHQ